MMTNLRVVDPRFRYFALLLLLFCYTPASAAAVSVSVDQRNGLPVVSVGGAPAVISKFVFWRANWSWAALRSDFKIMGPFDYAVTGKNSDLGFDLSGRIRKVSSRELVWEFDFDAHRTVSNVIGGGISFRFDLANMSNALGEPVLLPNARGWSLRRSGQTLLEMSFDPSMASVYFERGHKSEIRAFFYKGEVPEGRRRIVARLRLSGDAIIEPTLAERFGRDDSAWTTAIMNWPIAPWNVSPVDLSFLNAAEKPAGRRGFVKRDGERLVFEDGEPARFWGTNLTAWALFGTDRENVRQQARRLSKLGFNLVRLHHHDSAWVNPNIFGDNKTPDTQHLNSAALDKLDWWIKCLKEEGIYVWIDLHVGREVKAADGVDNFEEIAKGKPKAHIKGFNYVNSSIQDAMRKFSERYLTHLNPYTGLQYKDDPAIIAVLLTNENDVTNHFGNALLPDKKVPAHNAIYMARANAFASAHKLPKDKTWRSWEHGPSKIFLNDLEYRFNIDQIENLRRLGVRSLIATTSTFGRSPVSSLPAMTVGDVIAVHSYGRAGTLEVNPVYGANLMHWIAAAQVVGQPLTVPEWNVEPFPIPDRHTVPLYLASVGSLQGWDAMMQYAYSQQALRSRGSPSNWHAFNDPALIATLPAAALLYRRGDVQEARTTYVYKPERDSFFGEAVSAANSPALRTAAERGKLLIAIPETPELPWLKPGRTPEGVTVFNDPKAPLLPAEARSVASDTGELRRDWEVGIYTINTERTQAASGWIGGQQIALADVEIASSTRNATVAVQSLSDSPIALSRNILISLGAQSIPQGNNQPFHSEPVTGQLTIRAPAGLKLYRQHGIEGHTRELPVSYEEGRYRIELVPEFGTYWLMLR